jgi:hypothetical protein
MPACFRIRWQKDRSPGAGTSFRRLSDLFVLVIRAFQPPVPEEAGTMRACSILLAVYTSEEAFVCALSCVSEVEGGLL